MDNQSQQQVYTQPASSSPSKGFYIPRLYLIIGLSLLAIASFGSSAYLLLAQNQKSKILENKTTQTLETAILPIVTLPERELPTTPPPSSPTPTTIPTPTVSQDPYATWSAYVTTKYGYLVKYPKDWTVKNVRQQDPKILEYIVFNPKNATPSALAITLSYSTRSYAEALAISPQKGEQIIVALTSSTRKKHQDSNGNISYSAIIPTGKNTIIFYAQEKYNDIFNQMLSTFELLR